MFMIICIAAFAIVWLAMAGLVLVLSAEHQAKPNPERLPLGDGAPQDRVQARPSQGR